MVRTRKLLELIFGRIIFLQSVIISSKITLRYQQHKMGERQSFIGDRGSSNWGCSRSETRYQTNQSRLALFSLIRNGSQVTTLVLVTFGRCLHPGFHVLGSCEDFEALGLGLDPAVGAPTADGLVGGSNDG